MQADSESKEFGELIHDLHGVSENAQSDRPRALLMPHFKALFPLLRLLFKTISPKLGRFSIHLSLTL